MLSYSGIVPGDRSFTNGMTLDKVDGLRVKYACIKAIKEADGPDRFTLELDLGDEVAEHVVSKRDLGKLVHGTRSSSILDLIGKPSVDVLYRGERIAALSAHPHISYWQKPNTPWKDHARMMNQRPDTVSSQTY